MAERGPVGLIGIGLLGQAFAYRLLGAGFEVLGFDVDAGKTATFGEVLMFADGKHVTHGEPLISGAKVIAEVVEQRKDKKVIAFKYKRRKGYHRTVGHRRKLTRVKIKSITGGSKSKKS